MMVIRSTLYKGQCVSKEAQRRLTNSKDRLLMNQAQITNHLDQFTNQLANQPGAMTLINSCGPIFLPLAVK
jgi:hypothetical protein